ncbi:MAG: hypothetical protein QT11_C0001G0503 [archaeon GW2011_AR20]|nr:MAG: hypothetical protein QT11_C0001G0503 [archaeon GW2011_AR20]AQS28175.1 hypothetical protein [uncultured archaeon]MBS3160529.1 hypothetical protein [Candidatus Woesearchaeota archaeon]
MEILVKSITNLEQIKSRIGLADGIEIALFGKVPNKEMISLLRDNFDIVNFETSDAFERKPVYRLIDPFSDDEILSQDSRRLIEESFNMFLSLQNKGYFTIHNIASCRQKIKQYQLPSISEIEERKNLFHNYIRSLDGGNGVISLENVYPNTVNKCPYDYGDFGKLFDDFPENLGITFDISHYAITLAMYADGVKKEIKNNFVPLTREINFLSFIGGKEIEVGKEAGKRHLSVLLEERIQRLDNRVKVIHCSNVKRIRDVYEDGFLSGILDLSKIIKRSKADYIVPEVIDDDYIKIDNQRKIIAYLKSLLK